MAAKRDIELLCERIYDATIEPESWPVVLEEFAAASDSAWAALLTRRSDSWIGWRISPAAQATTDSYLRSDDAQRSITTARLFAVDHAGFISDHEHFSDDERRTDPFFRWARAQGYHHGAATGFRLNTGDLAVVQLMRRTGSRRFTRADLRSIDRLRPHFARAALLAARWKMERLRAASEALALIGIPAVVLTADCRVMTANSLASTLDDHLAWLPHNRLALKDERGSDKLKLQVAACAQSVSIDCASSFPAWDEARNAPLVVHVVPLKGDRRDLFEGGLALVLFTEVTTRNQPHPELIRELFDLTATEARVAAQLAQGLSVEQIAGAHSVSLSTVRSQAKSILQKLGAHRQAEVAARLGAVTSIPLPIREN